MLLNEGDNFLHMNCFQCIQFLFLSLQFHPFDTWLCKFYRHIEEYKHQTELSNKNIEQLRQKEHAKDDFRLHKKISHSSCVEKCKWIPNSFKNELIYMDLSHLQMKSRLKVKPSTSFFRWITYSWFGLNYVMFCVVFCKWKKFIAWKS